MSNPSPCFERRTHGGQRRAPNTSSRSPCCARDVADAVALAVDSIRIDLSIGGRFQLANTLTKGTPTRRWGTTQRAEAYLKRARGIHDSYGDRTRKSRHAHGLCRDSSRTRGCFEEPSHFSRCRSPQRSDKIPTIAFTRAPFILRGSDASFAEAQERAMVARQLAEKQTAASFHVLGQALEAYARIERGTSRVQHFSRPPPSAWSTCKDANTALKFAFSRRRCSRRPAHPKPIAHGRARALTQKSSRTE